MLNARIIFDHCYSDTLLETHSALDAGFKVAYHFDSEGAEVWEISSVCETFCDFFIVDKALANIALSVSEMDEEDIVDSSPEFLELIERCVR